MKGQVKEQFEYQSIYKNMKKLNRVFVCTNCTEVYRYYNLLHSYLWAEQYHCGHCKNLAYFREEGNKQQLPSINSEGRVLFEEVTKLNKNYKRYSEVAGFKLDVSGVKDFMNLLEQARRSKPYLNI